MADANNPDVGNNSINRSREDLRMAATLKNDAAKIIKTVLVGPENFPAYWSQLKLAHATFLDNLKIYCPDLNDDDAPHLLRCQMAYEKMNGSALAWFTTMAERNRLFRLDWDLLEKALLNMYDDPNRQFTAYAEWTSLSMTGKLDEYEAKFDELRGVLPTMSEEILVLHYINGLPDYLRKQVMSYFVNNKGERTLQMAREQAGVYYNSSRVPERRPNPTKKVSVRGFNSNGNNGSSGANTSNGISGANSTYGPDAWLKKNAGKFQFSAEYPGWIPSTLKGKFSDENGTVGHKLKRFCAVNDLCYYCRHHGHQQKDCQRLKNQEN